MCAGTSGSPIIPSAETCGGWVWMMVLISGRRA
jgi:hypothetical protein